MIWLLFRRSYPVRPVARKAAASRVDREHRRSDDDALAQTTIYKHRRQRRGVTLFEQADEGAVVLDLEPSP